MVTSIYEKERLKRLAKHNLAIETLYYNTNQSNSDIFVRSTDNKMNDNIISKAIKEKRYFLNNKLIHREKKFNPYFHYTIYSYDNDNEEIKCPNCGALSKAIDLIDGCNYCKTNFNLGFNSSNVIKKVYNWSFSMFINYKEIVLKIFLSLVCIFAFFSILVLFQKTLILFILCLICICSVYAILFKLITKKFNYKENIRNQDPVPKKSNFCYFYDAFFSDLYKELMISNFNNSDPNLIDMDVLDFCDEYEFKKDDINYIKIKVLIRKIYYTEDKKITFTHNWYNLCFKENNIRKDDKHYEVLNCVGCGNSISFVEKKCSSCGRINDSKNEWILINSKVMKQK